MATTMSRYVEDKLLNAIFNNATPVALALSARYVKLHTGAPGVNGTANAAANTTRKSLSSAADSAGVFTSINDLIWTSVPNSETYTAISLWDDPTAGNCLWVGDLSAPVAVTVGDTFTIATGSLTVTAL